MTVDEMVHSLHISREDVGNLKQLVESLRAFDSQLRATSPGAHRLMTASIEDDANACIALIAQLLHISIDEARQLVAELLDLGGSLHPQTTGSSIDALSRLVKQLNPQQ